jgi:hypothetical protein
VYLCTAAKAIHRSFTSTTAKASPVDQTAGDYPPSKAIHYQDGYYYYYSPT